MTFVCVVKTESGLCLAADTALSLLSPEGKPLTVWNTERKLYRAFKAPHKKNPVGVLHYGGDGLCLPMTEIIEDFRTRLSSAENEYSAGESYTVEGIALLLQRFIQQQYIEPNKADFFCGVYRDSMGLVVAGYSEDSVKPSVFELTWEKGRQQAPREVLTEPGGIYYAGQCEAASRLLRGYGDDLLPSISGSLWGNEGRAKEIIGEYERKAKRDLKYSAMPLPEAVETARWLMSATVGYQRFLESHPTVGGSFESCTLAKHTGFKWVEKRKRGK